MTFVKTLTAAAAIALAFASTESHAGAVPYPTPGTPNTVTYSFTAANDGDVKAYYAGSSAGYDERVGLLVNGVLTAAGYGLDDHSTPLGAEFDFGPVHAGDTLVFVDWVISAGGYVYSDPSMNVGYDSPNVQNHNHIYSTTVTAGQAYAGSPVGIYVAFEDLRFPGSDYNYHDDTFIFTNVASHTDVPEPASLALAGIALAGLAAARRKTR